MIITQTIDLTITITIDSEDKLNGWANLLTLNCLIGVIEKCGIT